MNKKLLVVGGGTAGHVNAGLSIIEYFKTKEEKLNILYVGTRRGIESKLVKKYNINIKYINIRGIKRENIFVLLYSLFLIPIALVQSFIILIKFKPSFVVGVGGFVSGPVVIVSYLLKIKTYILEQNSVMGFTNKLLAKFACKIFISFPLAIELPEKFRDKIIHTGNPIRDKINNLKKIKTNKFNLFVFGGSQGARSINYAIINILDELCKIPNLKIYHQTGPIDFNNIKQEYEKRNLDYELFPYILDIDKVYEVSSLIVSRAGASTISEILSTCIPSILIPLPTAADNHQYYNAKYLEKNHACILIEQAKLNSKILIEEINNLICDKEKLTILINNLKKLKTHEYKKGKAQELIYKTIIG